MVDSAASKVRKGKEPIPVEVRKLKRKRQKYYPKETKLMGVGSMVKKAIGNIIKGDAMNTGDPSKYAITRRALPSKKSGANYSGD